MTNTIKTLNERKLDKSRAQHQYKVIDPQSDTDDDGPELFIAQPTDDIPRNKLVEKLARGLQAYVQRMQKRESFYVTVVKLDSYNWQPAPRECATLVSIKNKAFLLGGLNYDANREVAQLKLKGLEFDDIEHCEPDWQNINFTQNEAIQGRCRHTSCAFDEKIFSFGGCFMFNRKRQVRECTNQVTYFDTLEKRYNVVRTKGINVLPRKDHQAAIFGQSMIIYGGQFENG